MSIEEPLPNPTSDEDDVFEIGERTIYRLKNQVSPFDPDDLGTMIVRPQAKPPADPLERLEDKIDVLTQAVEMLQRRLDSIDARIARLTSL